MTRKVTGKAVGDRRLQHLTKGWWEAVWGLPGCADGPPQKASHLP